MRTCVSADSLADYSTGNATFGQNNAIDNLAAFVTGNGNLSETSTQTGSLLATTATVTLNGANLLQARLLIGPQVGFPSSGTNLSA